MVALERLVVVGLGALLFACGSSERNGGPPSAHAGAAGQTSSGGMASAGGGDGALGGAAGGLATGGFATGGFTTGGFATGGSGGVAAHGGSAGTGAGGAAVGGEGGTSAGGSDAQAGGGAVPTESEACVRFYKVACNKLYNVCSDLDAVQEPCPWDTDLCPDVIFNADSNTTVADLEACTALWDGASCDAISQDQTPRCNFPAGDVAAGEPCAFSTQCATHTCGGTTIAFGGPHCGTCIATPLSVGDPCSDSSACPSDSECSAGICVSTYTSNLLPGALCTRFGQCSGDYRCFDTAAGDEQRCQTIPALGEECDRINLCVDGLYCADGVCAAAAIAGQPCSAAPSIVGIPNPRTVYLCAADAVCDESAAAGPTCVARGAAGEPCTPVTNAVNPRATCSSGLQCICDDDSCASGRCSIPRYAGESCAETGTRCMAGSTCVNATCQDSGLQGLARQYCGG